MISENLNPTSATLFGGSFLAFISGWGLQEWVSIGGLTAALLGVALTFWKVRVANRTEALEQEKLRLEISTMRKMKGGE